MTLHQIIDKVTGHFHLGNRSMVVHSCRYLGENNTRCAVGMFCRNDEETISRLQKMDELAQGLNNQQPDEFAEKLGFELCEVLQPEVANAPWDFWASLQMLHDDESLWDANGINQDGRNRAEEIKDYEPDQECSIPANQ
jgi:hypothetical protein